MGVDPGVTSVSISFSFITFMMLPIVGVLSILGTQATKLDNLGL